MSAAQIIEKPRKGTSVIHLPNGGFTDEQFFEFCMLNKGLRIERQANGKIIVMSPTTSLTGRWNARISGKLFNWNENFNLGEVFDSSSGFTLPNGAVLSPDASWISREHWDALDKNEQNKFASICPDFIVELRSASDKLNEVREKMEEYMANGCRLGWLVDPNKRQTMVYLPDGSVQVIPFEQKLNGGDVLPGFELIMDEVISE
jgi:Uma2 family endonuclease